MEDLLARPQVSRRRAVSGVLARGPQAWIRAGPYCHRQAGTWHGPNAARVEGMNRGDARVRHPLGRALLLAALATVIGACARAPASDSPVPAATPSPTPVPAPWSAPALGASAVPAIYVQVWRQAENRASCALLAPERLDPALQQAATLRAATFSGGWAVAYDLPNARSAFGVAGTGARAWDAGVFDEWPHRRVLADGSRVGYGPEGGGTPNWLAYVRIPQQECLYNVWSRRGREHLEELLGQLRFVTVQP